MSERHRAVADQPMALSRTETACRRLRRARTVKVLLCAAVREGGGEIVKFAQRLAVFGENVLTAKKPVPMWRRFAAHLLNMFAILLWVASILAFLSDQAALGWAMAPEGPPATKSRQVEAWTVTRPQTLPAT